MITTPLSRLADILNVDISSMNRADAQDAVCAEAEKNIRAHQHRINQLHSRVDQTERENAELRAKLEMLENPSKNDIKKIATDFYYWWHNQPGTNTAAGFDDWFESVMQENSNCPELPDGSRFECVGSCNKTHLASDLKNTNRASSMTGVCRDCWGWHPDMMTWNELPEFVPNSAILISEVAK